MKTLLKNNLIFCLMLLSLSTAKASSLLKNVSMTSTTDYVATYVGYEAKVKHRDIADNYGFFKADLSGPVTETLRFMSVGSDGTTLGTEMTISNHSFAKMFADGQEQLRIRTQWRFVNCGSSPVKTYGSDDERFENLKAALQSLSSQHYDELSQCHFQSSSDAASESLTEFYGAQILIVKANGDIELHGGSLASYFRPTHAPDVQKQMLVTNATKTILHKLKEYGALFAGLNQSSNAEKQAFLSDWMRKNKSLLLSALSTLDQNIGGVSTVDKISVVASIANAYKATSAIEDFVNNGQHPMDQILGSGF